MKPLRPEVAAEHFPSHRLIRHWPQDSSHEEVHGYEDCPGYAPLPKMSPFLPGTTFGPTFGPRNVRHLVIEDWSNGQLTPLQSSGYLRTISWSSVADESFYRLKKWRITGHCRLVKTLDCLVDHSLNSAVRSCGNQFLGSQNGHRSFEQRSDLASKAIVFRGLSCIDLLYFVSYYFTS